MKILFVCLGNICRSPIAEGIFHHKAKQLNLDWKIASAGTANYHTGKAPHISSQKVCQSNGINIGHQKAQQLSLSLINDYDLIFALDTENLKDILALQPSDAKVAQIKLLSTIIDDYPIECVPDPYYGDFSDYENVFGIINELCEEFFKAYK